VSKTKGTDVIALKGIMRARGNAIEQQFIGKLTPALREVYSGILATSWQEVADQASIYRAAAETLFPSSKEKLVELGRLLASQSYKGVYKLFLRLPSTQYIFERVARIWSSYFERGEASIETNGDKSVDVVVRDFEDLPHELMEAASGHYCVLLEATGCKNVSVQIIDSDPHAWRLHVTWQ
jgi:hypothetical protein